MIVFDGGDAAKGPLVQFDVGSRAIEPLVQERLYLPRLSPDGARLAFARFGRSDGDADDVVFVRSMRTGTEQSLGSGFCSSWTQRGDALVIGGRYGLRRATLTGRSMEVAGTRDGDCGSEIGPGRYLVSRTDDGTLALVEHGKRRTIASYDRGAVLPGALDPRGRRFAYAVTGPTPVGGLYTVDVERLRPARLLRAVVYGVSWSPDGRTLALSLDPQNDHHRQLWAVSADGGDLRALIPNRSPVNSPTWGPSLKHGPSA